MTEHFERHILTSMPVRAYGALRGWLGEEQFRLRFQNIGYLFTGNVTAGLLAIASFGLAARTLGPEQFGVLALLTAYVAFIEKVISFQSGQALIRYGTEAIEGGELEHFKGLVRLGFIVDFGVALIGTIVAIALSGLAASWQGWSSETQVILLGFCTILVFRVHGIPMALLRLWGRFRFFALEQAFNSTLRLGLVAIGFLTDQDLWYFALVFYLMQPVTIVTLMVAVWLEARQRNLLKVRAARVREITRRFPGIWRFAWSANLSQTLRASTMELDTLLVGAFTDTASAGLYHVAKRMGRVITQIGAQVQAVLYPEVMRFWVQREIAAFSHALRQTVSVLGGLSVILLIAIVITAEPLLTLVAGAPFAAASELLMVQVFAACLYLLAQGLRPALLSTGHERELLVSSFWATLLFQVTAVLLLPVIGPMGANIAHVISGITWLAWLLWFVRRAVAQAEKDPQAPAPSATSPDYIAVDDID
jgi:O-antigen/teichoic acid export membrane protein